MSMAMNSFPWSQARALASEVLGNWPRPMIDFILLKASSDYRASACVLIPAHSKVAYRGERCHSELTGRAWMREPKGIAS